MQTSTASLSKAYSYYLANQQAIYAQYPNAYIIIHDTQTYGPYKTGLEAYHDAFAQFEIGTFIVKYCGDIKTENGNAADLNG